MPNLTQEQFNKLISEINLNAISLTLKIPTFDENEAKRYANIYIKEKRLEKKSPLIMYYIISLLTESEKINFIKEHYNYIKENDEDVFLYDMLSPVSLAYYFSFENIKELYQLDKEIFMKIIKRNQENLFHGFTHEQYLEFYRIFKNEINQIENIDYINSLYHHNRCCYDNQDIENVYNRYTLQKTYNQEFIKMNLKEYDDKINSFSSNEINLFLNYIEDINIYENLLDE
jgi:hypothetical protein